MALTLIVLAGSALAQTAGWKCQACDVAVSADYVCPTCGPLAWGCSDCCLAYKNAGKCVCDMELKPLGSSSPVCGVPAKTRPLSAG